jgi:hypothetical protein
MWEDATAFDRFVQGSPHRDATEVLPEVTSGFRVTRWTFPGSAVPCAWGGVVHRRRGSVAG